IIGRQQDDVDLIRHIGAVFLFGVEDLQIDDIRLRHAAIVDIVAAAHERAAFIGQFGGKRHGVNLLSRGKAQAAAVRDICLFYHKPPPRARPPGMANRGRHRSSFSLSCFSWLSATCSVRMRRRESSWLTRMDSRNSLASSRKMMTT